ncbi:hypothetical protein N1851_006319 [Merluccius polli]|uniref:Uncharacterized protein n=1 Tax=Merluccius polli TaxID=89951 RepID=A0AA47N5K4_MERPO|nr:hypothetical protein N1851_006319 [Merluccius polli]
MILGTNVIKHVLRQYKQCDAYWKAVSGPCPAGNTESELYLSMLAGLDRWRGEDVPYKIGTVRSNSAVCLEPGREYLLWGKLPKSAAVSPGSTVMTELTSCRSAPRAILVARMVTSLRQDRWIPLKLINTSDKPVLVRRNAKLADVFPCIALEDMDDVQTDALLTSCSLTTAPSGDVSAVLQSHTEWETGARARAAAALHHVPQLVLGGQDSLPAYTEKELCDEQLKDRTLSRVLYYVERQPADLVRRTVEWIALSPFPDCPHVGSVDSDRIASVSLVSDNDPEMSEDHSIAPDCGPVSVNDMGADVTDSNTERLTVSCDSDTHTYTQTDGQTVTTHGDSASDIQSTDTQRGTVVSAVNRENPSLSTRVRSRFGRIIKPVNRLIHTMSG